MSGLKSICTLRNSILLLRKNNCSHYHHGHLLPSSPSVNNHYPKYHHYHHQRSNIHLRYNSTKNNSISRSNNNNNKEEDNAQQRAYAFYKHRFQKKQSSSHQQEPTNSLQERNVRIAMYATAVVIGALGATYASVPLYKIFCQMTGFGGTTQRVQFYNNNNNNTTTTNNNKNHNNTPISPVSEEEEEINHSDDTDNTDASTSSSSSMMLWNKLVLYSNIPLDMLPTSILPSKTSSSSSHGVQVWTDEDAIKRLASLRPISKDKGRLITVRFDSTVGDVLPWSFYPTQLDVKVVPGETALSFFTATNHSSKPITGVATYNVYPPKAGLYFNKIQCFCFEEQRLLPGETVDMPVFFFIDPDFVKDPQLSKVNHVTLSYTFFQTDVEEEENEEEK